MKKKLLAVFDVEESYLFHLMEYLTNKMKNVFYVKGFTDMQELLKFCSQTQIDILLILPDYLKDVQNNFNIIDIILLGYPDCNTLEGSYPVINKFQSAENLMKEVINYCSSEGETNSLYLSDTWHDTKIIGIYSPACDYGKTAFALALTYIYSKDSESLYMNLEEFSGVSKLFLSGYQKDLSDLFYFYMESPNKLSQELISTIQSVCGIDIIPPLKYSNDLRDIKVDEWKDFIYKITDATEYKVIILDLNNMINDVISLLEICSEIYIPIKNDSLSDARLSEFDEFLINTGKEEILSKMIVFNMLESYPPDFDANYIENLFLSPFVSFVEEKMKMKWES